MMRRLHNDDRCDLGVVGCSLQSEMTLRAEGGQTYYIVVDGDGAGSGGPFSLSLSAGPCVDAPLPIECIAHSDKGDEALVLKVYANRCRPSMRL